MKITIITSGIARSAQVISGSDASRREAGEVVSLSGYITAMGRMSAGGRARTSRSNRQRTVDARTRSRGLGTVGQSIVVAEKEECSDDQDRGHEPLKLAAVVFPSRTHGATCEIAPRSATVQAWVGGHCSVLARPDDTHACQIRKPCPSGDQTRRLSEGFASSKMSFRELRLGDGTAS